MERKRIVIFIPDIFSIGGVETVFITLIKEWCKTCDVTILTFQYNDKFNNIIGCNVRIDAIGVKRLSKAFFKIRKYIKTHPIDYFVSSKDSENMFSILEKLLLRTKTKFIITQHNYLIFEGKSNKKIIKMLWPIALRMIYPLADKVIAVSQGIETYILSLGVKSSKVVMIYNPIDCTDIEKKASIHPIVTNPDNQNYIIFCGRFSNVKNIPYLIKAFAIVKQTKELKLMLVGDGAEKSIIESHIKEFGLEKDVIFTGMKSNPYPYIKTARLLVLPSFSESFSMCILEAMALGITVVSTPTKGPYELIGNKYGYISQSFEDPQILADTIIKAIKEPIDPILLINRAREFDYKKIASAYLEAFESI